MGRAIPRHRSGRRGRARNACRSTPWPICGEDSTALLHQRRDALFHFGAEVERERARDLSEHRQVVREEHLLELAGGTKVGRVETLDDATAGKIVDQVDLGNDGGRALQEHRLGAGLLHLAQPVDPIAHAARVDALDATEIDGARARANPVDEISEIVVLVDDPRELHVGDIVALDYVCF